MNHLHYTFLEFAVFIPAIAAVIVGRQRDPGRAALWSMVASGLAFAATVGAWQDYFTLNSAAAAVDKWDLGELLLHRRVLSIDALSAPLLPMVALLFLLTICTTLSTKLRRFGFAWTLAAESVTLATLSVADGAVLVTLLVLGTIPPLYDLYSRRRSLRMFSLHSVLFVVLLVGGYALVATSPDPAHPRLLGVALLLGGLLVRSGVFPFHTWLPDLFQQASFGTALLYATPLLGAYGIVRLVIPVAPEWMLHSLGMLSLFTAVYCAGMALVQTEARRFFCYLFLSHASLVLVGLEAATPLALTGGLCMWLSVGLALGGFGLTLRAIEARRGTVFLVDYQGLYEHTPALAVCFLLSGLASVGFPGTFGFVSNELLVDGVVEAYPYVGLAVILAAALNGIAFVQVYFKIFTGTRYVSSIPLRIGPRERFAVLLLAGLILGGGILPQPGVESRYHAAMQILHLRGKQPATVPAGHAAVSSLPATIERNAGLTAEIATSTQSLLPAVRD